MVEVAVKFSYVSSGSKTLREIGDHIFQIQLHYSIKIKLKPPFSVEIVLRVRGVDRADKSRGNSGIDRRKTKLKVLVKNM